MPRGVYERNKKSVVTELHIEGSKLPVVHCDFVALMQHTEGPHQYIAIIHRTSDHPILGPPRETRTATSLIRYINFETGVMITQNTLYKFK